MEATTTTRADTRLKRLLPRHYKVIDMYLTGDFQYKDIAKRLNMSHGSVSRILSMPSAQDVIVKRRANLDAQTDADIVNTHRTRVEEAKDLMEQASLQAAGVLIEGLLCGDERQMNKSANDILDRVGLARVTKSESKNTSAILTLNAEDAARITETFDLDKDD